MGAELGGVGVGDVGASGLEKYGDWVLGSRCDLGEKKADVNVLCTSFLLLSEAMSTVLRARALACKSAEGNRCCWLNLYLQHERLGSGEYWKEKEGLT